jgi:hypothetical protein
VSFGSFASFKSNGPGGRQAAVAGAGHFAPPPFEAAHH